jgi:plastocyanin
MSIKSRVILVMAAALVLTTALAACSSGPTTVQIVETTKAQNKLDNAQATRQAVIDAGGDPDAQIQVAIDSDSAAANAIKERNAEATAQAEKGIIAEGVGSSELAQGAAFDVEVPDGAAQSGVIEVGIPSLGAEGVVFDPDIVKITVGSTVRWSHDRKSASSATSDPGQAEEWDSGDLHKGPFDKEDPSFEHTFTTEGCFTYKSVFSGDTGLGAVCVVAE